MPTDVRPTSEPRRQLLAGASDLRRADAGEVPQPLVRTVGPVLDLGDVVTETQHHLVYRSSQLLAAETRRGSLAASDKTCVLEPGLPRSTGLGPASSPPF